MIDDRTSLTVIRDFISTHADVTPLEKLLVVNLMCRKAEDHDIYDSQLHLANACNTDVRTVARSLKRIEELGWITRQQRRGKTSTIALNYEAIPAEEAVRLKITDEARELSLSYMQALQRHCKRKKFPRQWLPQQHVSAQRILNACEGDRTLAGRIVGHALSNPRHVKRARMSLYHLFGRWEKILGTYTAALEQAEQQRQAQEVNQ